MNKYKNPKICPLPTAAELRASLKASEANAVRAQLKALFDKDTFVETAAFTKRAFSEFIATEKSAEFEGVITGYGAIDGRLVFAFAEDASRMGGAIDERHAKKITDLYAMALSNGAPVIGIFDSNGADVFNGTASLAAYGRIISAVNEASGVIPQLAFVTGKCIGTASAIASMFDFLVMDKDAELYVSSPSLTGSEDAQKAVVSYKGVNASCVGYLRSLVSFLPDNSDTGVQVSDCTDNLNRMLGNVTFAGEGLAAISAIADNGVYYEVGADNAKTAHTAFATIGGVKVGVVANSYANNEGRLCPCCARKISRFVDFCDSFSIPVVTLVDSLGLAINKDCEKNFAPALAKLAVSYASATVPMVTVIIGHAIGASFVLLGSKSLGADVVYATDDSEIGALTAESGVAFAWDKYITEEKSREELIDEWKANVSSPVAAASSGEIDDIISVSELRARICSSLLMLSSKGTLNGYASRRVLPL